MRSPENNKNAQNGKAEQEDLALNRTMEMPASLLAAALADSAKQEIADDALIAPPRPGLRAAWNPKTWDAKKRLWLYGLLGVAALPLLVTLAGALSSPPHVQGVPTGRLVYMEADSPSEKTTTLRGLYLAGADGVTRLLVHETEPQETDGGVREWITQPTLSPDGTRVAYEKQFITLLEEKQSVENQIWVMPLTPGTLNPPHMVINLTKQKMKQVVGLAWDSDSSLLLLEDGVSLSIPTDTADPPLRTPLALNGLTAAAMPTLSAARNPALSESGAFAYALETPAGSRVLYQVKGQTRLGPAAAVFALAPTGDTIAFVPPGTPNVIRLYDTARQTAGPDLKVRWGWSVFGSRRITSLRWSPDGSQIAFTVSKPPVPDDEIFLVNVATGRTVQLPYRTGRAAWDWAK